jgi:hypothetical protein
VRVQHAGHAVEAEPIEPVLLHPIRRAQGLRLRV